MTEPSVYRPDYRLVPATGVVYDLDDMTRSRFRTVLVAPPSSLADIYPVEKRHLGLIIHADTETAKGARMVMDEASNRLVDYVIFLMKPARVLRSEPALTEHERQILDYLERVQCRRERPIRRYSRSVDMEQFSVPWTGECEVEWLQSTRV